MVDCAGGKMIDLQQGDCLELMKYIPDKSIDMILCDLPYGTTACKWDNVIPLDFLWEQYEKIIKPNGQIVLFGSQPFTTTLISSKIDWFREEIIWLKNKAASGMLAKRRHLKVHENILVFSPSGNYTYNPQKWKVEEKQFLTQRKTMSMHGKGNTVYGGFERQRKPDDGTRNPISVVAYAVPITAAKTKTYSRDIDIRVHPTQKPVALLEYLIHTYTNEGDTVLDNCMGSGSTGVACINTNRNFIGMELDERYFNIAKERLEQR